MVGRIIILSLVAGISIFFVYKNIDNKKKINIQRDIERRISIKSTNMFESECKGKSKENIYQTISTDRLLISPRGFVVNISNFGGPKGSIGHTRNDHAFFVMKDKIKFLEWKSKNNNTYELFSLEKREIVETNKNPTSKHEINIHKVKNNEYYELGIIGQNITVMDTSDNSIIAEKVEFIQHSRHSSSSGVVFDFCPRGGGKVDLSEFLNKVIMH